MHESELRTVLLIQAIEQSDRAGELLPHADRAEATRKTARDTEKFREALASPDLTPAAERFLVQRSRRLRERVELRSPAVRRVLALSAGASWLGRALCAVAFISGVGLSALDGSRRINILAFPLLGLILWNLLVYVVLLAGHLRGPATARRGSGLSGLYARWIRWRAHALLRRSSQFNTPLAASLRRFASEWSVVAHRLLILRAKRLFHICAALVALGLVAGLYVRGIGLRYEAGWESTFLEPRQVGLLLKGVYGPASALSGIALPTSPEAIQALRWTGTGGGAEAAPWIHLLALTAILYIVLPRLLAAGATTLSLWWASRRVTPSVPLVPYLRETLSATGEAVRHTVKVTPFAYEPDAASVHGLDQLLSAALGGVVTLDMRQPVRYGEEEAYVEREALGAGRIVSSNVLLMSLASTPESENHGILISGVRDTLLREDSPATLAVIVDEGPYVKRMGEDPSLQTRIEERRQLWREFVSDHGLRPCIVDLSRFMTADSVGARDRDALREALWTARDRAPVT